MVETRSLGICVNSSKMCGMDSDAMPMPVSRTTISARRSCARAASTILPPSPVYFAALCSRLPTTCASRTGSPRTVSSGSPASTSRCWLFCSSSGCTVSTAAASTSAIFTGSLTSTILPRAMRDTSSRSSTRRIMCFSCRAITPRDQMIFGSCVSPCMSMCEALRNGDNGLRSSCDSIARNSSRLTTASLSEFSARMRSRTSRLERLVGARQLIVGLAQARR